MSNIENLEINHQGEAPDTAALEELNLIHRIASKLKLVEDKKNLIYIGTAGVLSAAVIMSINIAVTRMRRNGLQNDSILDQITHDDLNHTDKKPQKPSFIRIPSRFRH